MQIRIATLEDLEGIHQVESVSFNDPWSKQSFSDELNNPMTTYLVAEQDKDILGFVGMWEVVGEGQITNVAVHTKARKRGIGKALIDALVDYSKSRKLEVLLLEVRESNEPAKSLYSLNGFKEIGKRKNYYTKPTEDALLMALALEE